MFAILLSLLSFVAVAQDKDDITKRFRLVGVVGESNHNGIVVIRDVESQRSIRLRLGQLLNSESSWMLTSISGNSVTLQNKSEKAYITYAPEQVSQLDSVSEPIDSNDDSNTFFDTLEELSESLTPDIQTPYDSLYLKPGNIDKQDIDKVENTPIKKYSNESHLNFDNTSTEENSEIIFDNDLIIYQRND